MRHLTPRQLQVRLLAFGLFSLGFMLVVFVAERVVSTATGVTFWTLAAAVLGVASLASIVRWQDAEALDQSEWQPSMLQRILGAALGFQAGLLGYFVAGDLIAAVVGCALFIVVLVAAWRRMTHLTFEAEGAGLR